MSLVRGGRAGWAPRQWPALVVLVTVAAGALWAWWPDAGTPPDTTAFEQALADLAIAPAVRFENTLGGQATMDLEFTATGHAIGSLSLAGIEADMVAVDGRLFLRVPAGTGQWANLNEEIGAAMRDAMTPAALAVGLSTMLARARDEGMRIGTSSVEDTPALRAALPAGDLYVTTARPHRVLRFDPGGSGEGGGPPPPPSLPSLPAPPPDDGDGELPEPEVPPGVDDSGLPQPPPDLPPLPAVPTTTELRNFVGAAAVQPPPEPGLGGTLSGIVTSARVDLESVPRDGVGRVYTDLQEAAGELAGAVNRDVVLEPQPPFLGPCGPASCQASVDVRVDHANGREVPTGMTVDMTVGGQPAGQCTAQGDLPATGSGRLSCTNDGAEWVAANRGGGVTSATAEVVPQAMTDADVDRVQGLLGRQAENVGFDHIEDSTPTDVADTRVERVMEELGLDDPTGRLRDLYQRVGRRADDQAADDVLTEAHVQDAQNVIAALPLDALDRDSTARVVRHALEASGRRELYRRLNMLRSAGEATEEIRAGTRVVLDVGAAPDYRSHGHRSQVVEIGGETFSFASLDLGPDDGDRRVDMAFQLPDGALVARQVVGAADELDDARIREIDRTAVGVPHSGPDRQFELDIREQATVSEIFRARDHLAAVPPPLVRDFEDIVPADRWRVRGVRSAFTNPNQTTYAVAVVVLADGTVIRPPRNRLRSSRGGPHAERALIEAGDLDRAVQLAAELGTPDQPARIELGVAKAPCANRHNTGPDNSCSTALANAWTQLRDALTPQQLANIDGGPLLVLRNHYQPNDQSSRTTTGDLQALRDAGFRIGVGRVNGAVSPSGQILLETLMETEATAERTSRPPAPRPRGTPRSMPPGTTPTLANVLDHNRATMRVSGYEFDLPKMRAVARAAEASGLPPEQLNSVNQLATTLAVPLHQQGVCL